MPLIYGNLNEHIWQILTTNHKNPRGAITKDKLAFEVAKIVKRRVNDIKVRVTLVFSLSPSKPTWSRMNLAAQI